MEKIKVGTASWTDKTLIKSGTFYPRQVNTAEGRLRFYAEHFDTVEVDSTYYAPPSEKNAVLWASRTPPGFIFHVKAYAMLTGHPTLVKSIPKVLQAALPRETFSRARVKTFPKEVVEAAFDMFASALRPLKEAGKLGCLLFQFPPWFVPSARAYAWLELVREKLPGHDLAVEFRNRQWLAEPAHERALAFLRDHGMAHVIVDAPWITEWAGPVTVTAGIVYMRFHGRNRENWFKKGVETVERYKYLYKEEELKAWADKARRAAQESERAFAIFNNCFQNYGVKNALQMISLLRPKTDITE